MSTRTEMPVVRALREGAWAVAPIVPGIVPFGLIVGFAAVEVGLGVAEASGFSVFVFAGASQLAAIELVGRGAPALVAIGTVFIINLRFLMYAASLAPHVADRPRARRAAAAYLLVDQNYALAVARFATDPAYPHRLAYFVGAGLPLWITWQLCTVLGTVVGDAIPDTVPLAFAVPLVFLALIPPAVTDRSTLVAGVAAAATAVAAAGLPANAGLLVAAAVGIAAGTAAALRTQP